MAVVPVVQTWATSMGGELTGGGEPLLEAGGAIGDSGLGKFGGGDLAAGVFDG